MALTEEQIKASKLCYPNERSNVGHKIFGIRQTLDSDEVTSLDQFHDLINHVVKNSSSDNVWAIVFQLIDVFYPPALPPTPSTLLSTPLPIRRLIANTFDSTPCKVSSSRLSDGATAPEVNADLFKR
ncbi:hypothetical protein EV127DRAFT_403874 [Xylaria flabelliformis]|nr:hypothetical protein EV127DRAFT_403874 [Xylaria flabelliformis]